MIKKAVLFTPFAPNCGGGATILRSNIPHLKGLDVEWLYLSKKPVKNAMPCKTRWIGKPLVGEENLLKRIFSIFLLWNGYKTTRLKNIVSRLKVLKADIYWVVAHTEGVLIASSLAKTARAPVHISINDDLVYAQFALSRIYRPFIMLAKKRFKEMLTSVASIDVVSERMQDYYKRAFGIDTVVSQRFIPKLTQAEQPRRKNNNLLKIGHIGALYSHYEFEQFCKAIQLYGAKRNLRVRFTVIGGHCKRNSYIYRKFNEILIDIPELEEKKAVHEFSGYDFMYAMYPFNKSATVFRQTSTPTKLTTYLQVKKPFFGHTPQDSSLAKIISSYNLGCVCDSLDMSNIIMAIDRIRSLSISSDKFEKLRSNIYGENNIRNIMNCLCKKTDVY
jgi:hypothetical protein